MRARTAPETALRLMCGVATLCVLSGCEPRPGKLRETVHRANDTFQIRIDVFDEGNMAHFLEPGCHVRLFSAPVRSDAWQQFGNGYFSGCNQTLTDRVRFVTEKVAYVFLQWWYRVTVDGGERWSAWDVPAHLQGRVYYNPRLIENVTIRPDGTGTMSLNPDGVVNRERLELQTANFGQQWAPR